MIAKELISHDISPLHGDDTGEQALTMMGIYHVKHMPLVDVDRFVGLLSEEIILDHDLGQAVGTYSRMLARPFCLENDHVFEVMSKIAEYGLTAIPVINAQEEYLGIVTMDVLLQYYAKSFSFTEPGSILVIGTTKPQYSLSEISRIVESENASILSTFLTSKDNSSEVLVTLKINKQDINNIIASFQRYEYDITASFSEYEYIDQLKERYDALMTYLNV